MIRCETRPAIGPMSQPIIRRRAMTMLAALFCANALAQTEYTDDQLLQRGQHAWDNNQCVKAAEFLFAYQLRNPPALQQDPHHRSNVQQVLDWCERNTVIRGADAASVGGKADSWADTGGGRGSGASKPRIDLRSPQVSSDPRRRCKVYATIAVAQNEAGAANRCSFGGNRWHSSYQVHFDWCLRAPVAAVRGETRARQSQLDRCAP